MRFDHIVVEESEGEIIVYLLVSHNGRKCADFLHQGKVDCAFLFLLMAEGNRQILESTSCSHLAIEKMEVLFLFSSSFSVFSLFFISSSLNT